MGGITEHASTADRDVFTNLGIEEGMLSKGEGPRFSMKSVVAILPNIPRRQKKFVDNCSYPAEGSAFTHNRNIVGILQGTPYGSPSA